MRRHLLALVAAAGLFFVSLGTLIRRHRPLLPTGTKLLFFGDSHAVGLSLGGLCEAIAATGGRSCAAAVVGGTGAPYWQWHLGRLLREHKPYAVLASIGGNDMHAPDPIAVRSAMVAIVTMVRDAGAKLYWIDPTPLPWTDPRGIAAGWARVADAVMPRSDAPRGPDKVHLSVPNYHAWALAIAARLVG